MVLQVTHMGLAAIQDAVLQRTDLLLVDGDESINPNNTNLGFIMQVGGRRQAGRCACEGSESPMF